MDVWNENSASMEFTNQNSNFRSFDRGRGGGRGRGNRRNDFKSYDNNGQRDYDDGSRYGGEEKTITVDTSKIGIIIGRAGANIRQLEQESGAKININKNDRTETTPVRIQGSTESIENAVKMINDLLCNDGPMNSGGESYHGGRNERTFERRSQNSNYERRSQNTNRNYENNSRNYENNSRSYENNSRSYENSSRRNQYENSNSNYKNDSYQSTSDNNVPPKDDFKPINWDAVYQESEQRENEILSSLPPIIKKTYVEDPEVANMSPQKVAEFREKNMNISVTRVFAETEEQKLPIPNPILKFEHAFKNYPEIMETINNQSFETPSPIQSQAWPIIMSGEDMIGIAQTGTGKTLAFLLPAFLHIEAQTVPRSERVGPTVLILSPTRELALQIENEINKYSYRDIKCVCIYGGGNRQNQIQWIRRDRPEIIVATPGRLDDLVMGAEIKLDSVTYVVLDEADKMLEMGFECQIRKILIHVRKDRQSIMTSATWPSGVRRLASQYSVNAIQVVVGSLDLTAVHSVSQKIMIVDEEEKRDVLEEFLSNMEPNDKVIVFCGKKSVTDNIASDLILKGVKCQSLHGNREQCDREQALDDLKTGEVHILIATDVAARGIDIIDITHIFNYDFPKNIEEYVHRIGRTGRAGRTGESISLFTRRDWANAGDLIKILEEANQGVPEELLQMSQRFEARKERDGFERRGGGGGGGRRGGGRGGNRGGGFGGDRQRRY